MSSRSSSIECAFTGRLGRDADALKYVKGGELALLGFSCAVEGVKEDDDAPATWVRVAVFGDQAEQLAPRLTKGVKVYVEGRLEVSLWQPDDGRAPRVNLNVAASLVQPMGQIGKRRPRRTERRDDPRQERVEELAARFDERPPDEVPW